MTRRIIPPRKNKSPLVAKTDVFLWLLVNMTPRSLLFIASCRRVAQIEEEEIKKRLNVIAAGKSCVDVSDYSSCLKCSSKNDNDNDDDGNDDTKNNNRKIIITIKRRTLRAEEYERGDGGSDGEGG